MSKVEVRACSAVIIFADAEVVTKLLVRPQRLSRASIASPASMRWWCRKLKSRPRVGRRGGDLHRRVRVDQVDVSVAVGIEQCLGREELQLLSHARRRANRPDLRHVLARDEDLRPPVSGKLSPHLRPSGEKFGQDRGLVTWSEDRAMRDKKTREDILNKMRKKRASKKRVSAKAFVSNSNYTYLLKGLDSGEPELDEAKIAAAEKKDGFFALVTNISDMSADALIQQYKQLWRIEDAFGELKGTLKARPIFHWTDDRIVGHLAMCFIALFCEAHLTRVLRTHRLTRDSRAIREDVIDPRPRPSLFFTSWPRSALSVSVGKQTIWVRTDISGHVARLPRPRSQIPAHAKATTNVVTQTLGESLSA